MTVNTHELSHILKLAAYFAQTILTGIGLGFAWVSRRLGKKWMD